MCCETNPFTDRAIGHLKLVINTQQQTIHIPMRTELQSSARMSSWTISRRNQQRPVVEQAPGARKMWR
eukprot:2680047-Pleurochrysis_carterae.AAC.1